MLTKPIRQSLRSQVKKDDAAIPLLNKVILEEDSEAFSQHPAIPFLQDSSDDSSSTKDRGLDDDAASMSLVSMSDWTNVSSMIF